MERAGPLPPGLKLGRPFAAQPRPGGKPAGHRAHLAGLTSALRTGEGLHRHRGVLPRGGQVPLRRPSEVRRLHGPGGDVPRGREMPRLRNGPHRRGAQPGPRARRQARPGPSAGIGGLPFPHSPAGGPRRAGGKRERLPRRGLTVLASHRFLRQRVRCPDGRPRGRHRPVAGSASRGGHPADAGGKDQSHARIRRGVRRHPRVRPRGASASPGAGRAVRGFSTPGKGEERLRAGSCPARGVHRHGRRDHDGDPGRRPAVDRFFGIPPDPGCGRAGVGKTRLLVGWINEAASSLVPAPAVSSPSRSPPGPRPSSPPGSPRPSG